MSQPFYSLRPNKHIDRILFVETLHILDSYLDFSDYTYIGFGSYTFDDFKAVYKRTRIKKYISIESDSKIFQRALFNLPNNCTTVVNATSTDYLEESMPNDHKIVWFDYTSPSELGRQFADLSALCSKLISGDIVRITINANASSLASRKDGLDEKALQERRKSVLKERIGDYLPLEIDSLQISTTEYPSILLKSIHNLLLQAIKHDKYDPRLVLPLFSTVYADGQQMLTFTFIVLDDDSEIAIIKEKIKLEYIDFDWDKAVFIALPNFTTREKLAIEAKLPNDDTTEIKEKFKFLFSGIEQADEEIANYLKMFRYYPNYFDVNF